MNAPEPIQLIIGDEAHLVKQNEQRLVELAFGGASPGFNLATYSAEDGAEGALEMASTVPMMAKQRVVVVRQMEAAPLPLIEGLLRYAQNPMPTTLLLLTGAKLPGAKGLAGPARKLEAAIKKTGRVVRHSSRDQKPDRFAQQRADALGVRLDRRAADLLVQLVGKDLGQLASEVDKAANFVGEGGTIDADVIGEVTSLVGEAATWDLTDALVARDVDKALGTTHRLLEAADSPHRLLAMVTWQVRQLLVMQECFRSGRDLRSAGVRIPGFKIKHARRSLEQHPLDASHILTVLADANRAFHTRKIGERRIFEALILELTRR